MDKRRTYCYDLKSYFFAYLRYDEIEIQCAVIFYPVSQAIHLWARNNDTWG